VEDGSNFYIVIVLQLLIVFEDRFPGLFVVIEGAATLELLL